MYDHLNFVKGKILNIKYFLSKILRVRKTSMST